MGAASASPTATPTETAAGCPPEYVQVASNNAGNKVNAEFAAQYANAVAQAGNVSDAFRSVILEQSGKDVTQLTINAHAFKLIEDPNKRDGLVADGCLSPEGIKLHNQLEGALNVGGMTFEEAEAPENAFNSGVGDGGMYGVSSTSGIYGDRKAIKVTMKDGSVVYIMIRCGNPVFPGKPNLPDVPTDNPPPPEKPKPVCEWNPSLPPDSPDCLQPKSKDKTDYRSPGDGGGGRDSGTGEKPQAPVTPVQPAPAPVEESRPGGNGIVDTPGNKPESDSGVTAPDAKPAPTTPSQPNPDQGGENDGKVEAPSW